MRIRVYFLSNRDQAVFACPEHAMKRFALLLLPLTLFLPCVEASEWIMTPEELQSAAATKDDLIILDVSFDRADYDKGHIPGAQFVDWNKDLSDEQELYYRVPTQEQFESMMSRIGATRDSKLVFYDNRNNRMAIRGLWVADFYGHQNAAILEGGLEAWKTAGLPVNHEIPSPRPTVYRAQDTHPDMNVDHDFVHENLRNQEVLFVDSRPWEMFTGETPGVMIDKGKEVARIGHLPGAVSLPWKKSLDEHNAFLDIDQLKDLYSEMGVTPDKLTIFYCNEGLHAAFNWFVAVKLLGNDNIKIYEGSMGEWASDPKRPLVSGVGF